MMTAHSATTTHRQLGWRGYVRSASAVVVACSVEGAHVASLPITRNDAKREPSGLERGDPA
jgi:hypothetical protein